MITDPPIYIKQTSCLDTEADCSPDVFRGLLQASKLVPDSDLLGTVTYQLTIDAE